MFTGISRFKKEEHMSNKEVKQTSVVEVEIAYLKDSVSIPSTRLNNDTTLNAKKAGMEDVKMLYDGANLIASFNRPHPHRVLIPASNIRGMKIAE